MNMDNEPESDAEAFEQLKKMLARYDRVALAFSAGVDSSFLLAALKAAGVAEVLAVTLVSPFFTAREKARARRVAVELNADHLCLDLDVLADEDVVKNDLNRCYFCKRAGFSAIRRAAEERGISTLLHGINTDDLKDYRPGMRAAEELGFEAPLVVAGFSKQAVRLQSRVLGLETWDLPSQSCLATRIPTGDRITGPALDRIERAEHFLHSLGLAQVRVRSHGDLARIEAPAEEVESLSRRSIRETIAARLKELGFNYISLDLEGYQTGRMNPGQAELKEK